MEGTIIKLLYIKLTDIFKKAKYRIIGIWFLDVVSAGLSALFPLVIGNAIDGLINQSFSSFKWLIGLEVFYLLINTLNKYVDTRVYSQILENESTAYYENAVNERIEDSVIDARENMVDDLTGFLETGLPSMASTLIGVLIALWYLATNTTWITVILAITISITVFALTFKWLKKIADNNKKSKDESEKRQDVLRARDVSRYRGYIHNILKIGINSSDIDSKSYGVSYFMQLILIITAVYLLTLQRNFTAGLIYATITYLYQLNTEVLDIPSHFIEIRNLIDTSKRLHNGNN